MDFLLFAVAEKILINYPKDPLDNPLSSCLKMIFRISYNCKSGGWGHRPRRMPRLAFPPTARWETGIFVFRQLIRQPLVENKLWSIAQPYYLIFLKKGLQTSYYGLFKISNPLVENKLWSIVKPYYFIFLKKGLQTS